MKKIILISAATLILSFIFITSTSFALGGDSGIPTKVQIPTYENIGVERSPIESAPDITKVVIFATQGWYTSFFIFAVIFILIAAFKYLTAAGKPENIQTAHKMLIWAAVAVAIALIAVGATQIIKSFLGGGDSGFRPVPENLRGTPIGEPPGEAPAQLPPATNL